MVYDTQTTLYEGKRYVFREMVKPGAFRNAMADGADVRALFNHDSNIVLGRNKSGTLTLQDGPAGLDVIIDPPDTQAGRDVVALIGRGDVTGMSFAFSVRAGGETVVSTEDKQGRTIEDRTLTDLNLFDVSVVTYPAYEATSVALRSSGMTTADLAERDKEQPAPTPLRDKWAAWVAGE